jgi:hypothetical protein
VKCSWRSVPVKKNQKVVGVPDILGWARCHPVNFKPPRALKNATNLIAS